MKMSCHCMTAPAGHASPEPMPDPVTAGAARRSVSFLVDQCLDPELAVWLRDVGIDAVHAGERGLHLATDEEILLAAAAGGRVLLTADTGFGAIYRAEALRRPSMVLVRSRSSVEQQVHRLLDRLGGLAGVLGAGAIVALGSREVRVRMLPLSGGR
jgi:predicted nuclease of predicted toxin-antitoxin system